MIDSDGRIHISLVTSKTKVAPIKRLTIPRLELCGAHLLARLLYHVQNTFGLPLNCVYAWTDSTIVLSWLVGNPRCFKTYVGNRIYHILELTSPDRWNHVDGADNPADSPSRGLLPSELLGHGLWWYGPKWSRLNGPNSRRSRTWIHREKKENLRPRNYSTKRATHPPRPTLKFHRHNLVFRFANNCRIRRDQRHTLPHLSVQEILRAGTYWLVFSQEEQFGEEIDALKTN
jgi:hypothetical protein